MRGKSVKGFVYGSLDKSKNIDDRNGSANLARSIAEEYLEGGLNIHIHIGFGTEEYCALFNRDSQIRGSNGTLLERSQKVGRVQFGCEGTHGEQEVSVFIRVVKGMEVQQPFPIVHFPRTIARLKRINNGANCVGHAAELTSLATFILGGIIVDRELSTPTRFIPFGQDELPGEMIKRTSEIVEHFSNENIEVVRQGRYIVETMDLLSRFFIYIFGDNIGFEITEGRKLLVQHLELLCSPVILTTRTIEGGHNDTLQKDSTDTQGARDSRAHQRRVHLLPKKLQARSIIGELAHEIHERVIRVRSLCSDWVGSIYCCHMNSPAGEGLRGG